MDNLLRDLYAMPGEDDDAYVLLEKMRQEHVGFNVTGPDTFFRRVEKVRQQNANDAEQLGRRKGG